MPRRTLSRLVPFCFRCAGDVLKLKNEEEKKRKNKKQDPGGQTQEKRAPKHTSASNYLEIESKKSVCFDLLQRGERCRARRITAEKK